MSVMVSQSQYDNSMDWCAGLGLVFGTFALGAAVPSRKVTQVLPSVPPAAACSSYAITNPGGWVSITFVMFSTQAGFDFMMLYNGPSSRSPLIAVFSGQDALNKTFNAREGKAGLVPSFLHLISAVFPFKLLQQLSCRVA